MGINIQVYPSKLRHYECQILQNSDIWKPADVTVTGKKIMDFRNFV